MTYHIKQTPQQAEDKEIYFADIGRGYIKNNELHLTSATAHFVYKFKEEVRGWYMRNIITQKDYKLSVGASPTLNLENVMIKDAEYWNEITYIPTSNEE